MLAESAGSGHAKTEALSQVDTHWDSDCLPGQPARSEAVLLGGYFAPLTKWRARPIETELEQRALAGGVGRKRPLGPGAQRRPSGCRVLAAELAVRPRARSRGAEPPGGAGVGGAGWLMRGRERVARLVSRSGLQPRTPLDFGLGCGFPLHRWIAVDRDSQRPS